MKFTWVAKGVTSGFVAHSVAAVCLFYSRVFGHTALHRKVRVRVRVGVRFRRAPYVAAHVPGP